MALNQALNCGTWLSGNGVPELQDEDEKMASAEKELEMIKARRNKTKELLKKHGKKDGLIRK